MTKQLLIYETAIPVSSGRHAKCSVDVGKDFAFMRGVNSVPLMAVEFPEAAQEYVIVFAGAPDDMMPLVVLGARQNENLYIDVEGHWAPNTYVPAFVRRYPFVLAEKPAAEEGDDFTVFLDEGYEGFNKTEGERLFKEDGTDAELLTNAVNFLGEFQQNIARTKKFMEHLVKHDLLEPRNVQLQKGGEGGKAINLNGLYVINEDKLRALDAQTTHELVADGVLGWAYAHLMSLLNIDRLAERLDARELAEADAKTSTN